MTEALAMSPEQMESHFNVWERECCTISERFPDMSGIMLWSLLERHIVAGKVHRNFFAKRPDGSWDFDKPLLRRSKHNNRDESDTRAHYESILFEVGFHQFA